MKELLGAIVHIILYYNNFIDSQSFIRFYKDDNPDNCIIGRPNVGNQRFSTGFLASVKPL